MKISVIIPCYNAGDYIGQAIGSLLEQSRPADEIIIVDDGSTDKSADIVAAYGNSVQILRGEKKGAPKARNLGADIATGDAIMFLDADDVLGPKALEALEACLTENSGGIVACSWYRLNKTDGKWIKKPRTCEPIGDEHDKLSGWLSGWWHPPCSVMWSRDAYEKTGGWDPSVFVNQDGDLIMRALVSGINLHITNEGSAFYRRHPHEHGGKSLSSKRHIRKGRRAQIFVIKRIAERLAEQGLLDVYRRPLTKAFDKIRVSCKNQYPSLENECLQLINEYGEPRYVRYKRKVGEEIVHLAYKGLNLSARMLTKIGMHDTRRILSALKNRQGQIKSKQGLNIFNIDEQEIGTEITYGLRAYRQAMSNKVG